MKKLLFTLALCLTAGCAMAQQEEQGQQTQPEQGVLTAGQPFEGEIELETYENYSDVMLQIAPGIHFNGVHKARLILKGNKMHLIDTTIGLHTIVVDENTSANGKKDSEPFYAHFCELTKTGIIYKGEQLRLLQQMNQEQDLSGRKDSSLINTYAPTSTTKVILDKTCTLHQGEIIRKNGFTEVRFEIKAWVSDIPAPPVYRWYTSCFEASNILLKYITKTDGGHIGYLGEMSSYNEIDVTKIISRPVEDTEFEIPKDCKFEADILKYSKETMLNLTKADIKGAPNETKSTGVHYQTNDEWDF